MLNTVEGLRLPKGYWYLGSPYSRWEGGLDDAAFTIAKIRGRLVLRRRQLLADRPFALRRARREHRSLFACDLATGRQVDLRVVARNSRRRTGWLAGEPRHHRGNQMGA